ncbi:MAG: multidrug efflux SMR transporter [Trueperella sp.]|nr:multidrug efflux SMR transporter [Trueperella sp.]
MSWLILVISAVFEAVWATALGQFSGWHDPLPIIIFLIATIISVTGLSWAMREISVGTAYAVWTAIGSALTVTYAMLTGNESVSVVKILLLLGIIGCVVGLKLAPSNRAEDTPASKT